MRDSIVWTEDDGDNKCSEAKSAGTTASGNGDDANRHGKRSGDDDGDRDGRQITALMIRCAVAVDMFGCAMQPNFGL
jgi:hypothetical protein